MYDPQLGRFLAVDPHAENYFSWSTYNYVGNNPIRRIDPDGKDWDDVLDGVQIGLDIVGMIPAVGNIADLANAGISVGRGDYTGAALSMAAAIPGAGLVAGGAKLAKRAIGVAKTVDKTTDVARAMKRGIKNEAKVIGDMNLTKNNKTFTAIDPKTGNAINVKPDAIDTKQLTEIKDTKYVSNTKQIRGEREVAKQLGKDFKIVTGESTKVAKTIPKEEIIRRSDIGPQK